MPIQQATRDDEPGCIVYCFAADPCQDDLIQVYELWESEEALMAHFAHPNYLAMRSMLNDGGLVGRGEPQAPHRRERPGVRPRPDPDRRVRLTLDARTRRGRPVHTELAKWSIMGG